MRSEVFQVTIRLIDALFKKVIDDGANALIVTFPDWNDLVRMANHQFSNHRTLKDYRNGQK